MTLLYWLLVVLIILAIPLALLTDLVLLREFFQQEADSPEADMPEADMPEADMPARPAQHRRAIEHDGPGTGGGSWIEDLQPERTPPVEPVEHCHEFGPEGPIPCWCGWGDPVQPARIRPYYVGQQPNSGQAIIP